MGIFKKKFHSKIYSFILVAILVINIFIMIAPPMQVLAAGDNITTIPVTLEISPTKAKIGDEITLNGDANPDTFVSIKVVDGEGSIVYFDGVKSGSDGKYSTIFIVPDDIDGDLTIVAGYGENVAVKVLEVIEDESDDPLLPAPELKSETIDNFVGKPVELTFTDDENWRNNIVEIYVDNQELQQDDDYKIGVGVITISANLFMSAGNYDVIVKATGYQDAAITLKIKRESTTTDPIEDEDIVLEIKGEGVTHSKKYTQSQLEDMPRLQEIYSCINTWPTKQWYIGEGVALSYLLGPRQADIKPGATLIKFTSKDGYYMTLTVEELLEDHRYRFPNFKTGKDGDGHVPGSTKGKVEVETILALTSTESDNPSYMNELDALHLMIGQRAVTEQTGPLFVKNINKIEVLTKSVPKWDAPEAEPGSGTVPTGTGVRLKNKNMDQDKIHYTTDGSTPTLDSPIYNWVAKRWWSARGDEAVEKINHPIEITKDTVIKAVTIGAGKENSDIITFTYKVTDSKPGIPDVSDKIEPSEGGTISLGDDVVMEIPAGALIGAGDLEVKIERVKETPTIPAGFKLLSDVFEFSVNGKQSYEFAKKVKIKFGFDPEALHQVGIPAIYYYDEAQNQWEEIESVISGNTIAIEIDYLAKLAIMVPLKPEGLQFSDIINHWAQDDIGRLVTLGAIKGYPDNSFKPDNNITRAEFATVLIRVLELPLQNGKVFADTGGHWASDMISTAAHHGIVNGYDDNTFGPDEPITREQMAAMIIRVAELAPEEGELSFADNDRISDWARNSIVIAVKNRIINGYPDNTIRPQGLATRAEAVTIIVREMDRREK